MLLIAALASSEGLSLQLVGDEVSVEEGEES